MWYFRRNPFGQSGAPGTTADLERCGKPILRECPQQDDHAIALRHHHLLAGFEERKKCLSFDRSGREHRAGGGLLDRQTIAEVSFAILAGVGDRHETALRLDAYFDHGVDFI